MNQLQIKSAKHILLASALSVFALGCKSTKKSVTADGASAKYQIEQESNLHKLGIEGSKRIATEESIMREARITMKIMKENAPKVRLNEYFNAIAYSENNSSANSSITKALAMFTSSETTVLIRISEDEGKKRYARPTTIMAYFNHLKELKENNDDIKNLKLDSYGMITEVELKKND